MRVAKHAAPPISIPRPFAHVYNRVASLYSHQTRQRSQVEIEGTLEAKPVVGQVRFAGGGQAPVSFSGTMYGAKLTGEMTFDRAKQTVAVKLTDGHLDPNVAMVVATNGAAFAKQPNVRHLTVTVAQPATARFTPWWTQPPFSTFTFNPANTNGGTLPLVDDPARLIEIAKQKLGDAMREQQAEKDAQARARAIDELRYKLGVELLKQEMIRQQRDHPKPDGGFAPLLMGAALRRKGSAPTDGAPPDGGSESPGSLRTTLMRLAAWRPFAPKGTALDMPSRDNVTAKVATADFHNKKWEREPYFEPRSHAILFSNARAAAPTAQRKFWSAQTIPFGDAAQLLVSRVGHHVALHIRDAGRANAAGDTDHAIRHVLEKVTKEWNGGAITLRGATQPRVIALANEMKAAHQIPALKINNINVVGFRRPELGSVRVDPQLRVA